MSDNNSKTTSPAVVWTAQLDQNISHPLVVIGSTLIVATKPSGRIVQHSSIQAISLEDGRLLWRHEFQYALISGMQAYTLIAEQKEIVIVATSCSDILRGEGSLLAFDEAGEVYWQWRGDGQHYGAPVVANRQVVVAEGKSLLVISPEDDGDDVKSVAIPVRASQSAPVIEDNVAYIPCRSSELLAVELDGDVRWHFQYQGGKRDWLDKTPVIAGLHIFAVSSQGLLYALDRASGNLDWKTDIGENRPLSRPVVNGKYLFVGHRDGLDALDVRNGRSHWQFPTDRPISATPLVIHDTVYVTCENHFLYAFAIKDGTERWRYELKRRIEEAAILAPNGLLVADRGGNIAALERPFIPESSPVAPVTSPLEKQKLAVALSEQGNHLKAAQLLHDLGKLEQAAQSYEAGKNWAEAAELWQQIDRYGKRAQALKKHAKQLSTQDVDDEDKAMAWEKAARAYAETREKDQRHACEREAARFRHQAILSVEVEPDSDLVLDAWGKLNFTIRNAGFGVARRMSVGIKDDRFEGQTARTQTIITLQPEQDYAHWLDVVPRAYGSDVPMRLLIEYSDKANHIHSLERTFYLSVLPETGMLTTQPRIASATDSWELPTTLPVPAEELRELRNKLIENFNKEELLNLIFDLGLNTDVLGDPFTAKIRSMITYMVRKNRFDELLDICREQRPHIEW